MKRLFLAPLCLMALSTPAFAASLGASCFLPDDTSSKVEGTNINKRMPIASVSKIMTAYFSTFEKGLDYRFATKVHVTTVAKGLYDIHLEGSRDPYFGKESLHFMMAQLNKLGVTKVRDLTFDQSFKFFWINSAHDMYRISAGNWRKESPSPSIVLQQLKKQNLTSQYSATVAYAKARGIQMPAQISWSQKTIAYKPAKEFKATEYTQTYRFRSSKLQTLLKEMNRNSNNHAAI
ncbi:MAG: D-alanyl-D-alanine carboxypeptidase [Pseudobdellovibrionaceae bacterium]